MVNKINKIKAKKFGYIKNFAILYQYRKNVALKK